MVHLPGKNRKWEQFAVLDEDFLKTGTVTDDDILGGENRPGKMPAIRPAEYFDKEFMALAGTEQSMNQANIFHGVPTGQ